MRNRHVIVDRCMAGALILAVFLLAFTKTKDFDAWLHLSFGRLIWQQQSLPATEPFAYSLAGQPFSYSSWLFAVVYYGAYRFLGEFGIALLKGLSAALLFLILLMDSLQPNRKNLLAIPLLMVVATYVQLRFVERPDLFYLIFLAFSVFSLNAFLHHNRKYLYLLPLVHCIWANSHSSIGTMVVPFLAVLVGGGLHILLAGRSGERTPCPTVRQLKVVALIFLLSAGAALISPYGIGQFTFASQFLANDVFKQQIVELLPPTWSISPWYYLLAGATVLSFLLTIRTFSFIDLFLLLPFLYLSLTTRRFVFVFLVVAVPPLTRNFGRLMERFPFSRPRTMEVGTRRPVALMASLAWIALWLALSFTGSIPLLNLTTKPGFGFDLAEQPEGALSYLDRRGVNGPLYNSFHWGQYIVWRDFPRRLPLLDGRGYMAADLLESMAVPQDPEGLYRKYGVEAALVSFSFDKPAESIPYDRNYLNDPHWALVYWDDFSMVYLRRGGRYDAVIQQDEYRLVRPAQHIRGIDPLLADPDLRSRIVAELKRSIGDSGAPLAHLFLAHVYTRTGHPREALQELPAEPGKTPPHLRCLAYEEEGAAYRGLGDFHRSLSAYTQALALKESAALHLSIAENLIDLGRDRDAIPHLESSIGMNKRMVGAYQLLAAAYTRTGHPEDARRVADGYAVALRESRAEQHFKAGIKAYLEHHMPEALAEFQQTVALDPGNGPAFANIGFVLYDSGQFEASLQNLQKAVANAPDYANAHYGLAMNYARLGNRELARTHWQRYLQLEPRGFYSRRAREALESLR